MALCVSRSRAGSEKYKNAKVKIKGVSRCSQESLEETQLPRSLADHYATATADAADWADQNLIHPTRASAFSLWHAPV